MKKPVSVLVVPKIGEPKLQYLPAHECPDDGLEAMQEIVGGRLSADGIFPGISIYTNDNGRNDELPYNRCGFLGRFFVGKASSAGNAISLTERDVEKVKDWLVRNDNRPPKCHVCGKTAAMTFFCSCRDVVLVCGKCYEEGLTPEKSRCPRCKAKK